MRTVLVGRRLSRWAARAAAVGATSHVACCESNSTPEQKAQPTAMAAHWRWLAEESKPDYLPPDTSFPELADRPARASEPTLRRELATCGDITDEKCYRVGTQLATCLLGGVLRDTMQTDDEQDASAPSSFQKKAEGVVLLQTVAARGYADAACALGVCYDSGLGVDADGEMALEYYRIAAEHGHKHGQNALGIAYYLGQGTPVDTRAAVEWFERAASQSHPGAMFMLGECLLDGLGVQADRDAAYRWFLAAGDLGHVSARERVRRDVLGLPKRRKLQMRHSQHVVDFHKEA